MNKIIIVITMLLSACSQQKEWEYKRSGGFDPYSVECIEGTLWAVDEYSKVGFGVPCQVEND